MVRGDTRPRAATRTYHEEPGDLAQQPQDAVGDHHDAEDQREQPELLCEDAGPAGRSQVVHQEVAATEEQRGESIQPDKNTLFTRVPSGGRAVQYGRVICAFTSTARKANHSACQSAGWKPLNATSSVQWPKPFMPACAESSCHKQFDPDIASWNLAIVVTQVSWSKIISHSAAEAASAPTQPIKLRGPAQKSCVAARCAINYRNCIAIKDRNLSQKIIGPALMQN